MDYSYEHKYGNNKIPIFVKLFMTVWFSILFYTIYTGYISNPNPSKDGLGGIVLFVSFSVVVFTFLILSIKRNNVFIYGDYLIYRSVFGSRDIYYSDIHVIEMDHRSDNGQGTWYFVLWDDNNEFLARIPVRTIGHIEIQREFLELLLERNGDIKYDRDVGYILGERDDYRREVTEQFVNDVKGLFSGGEGLSNKVKIIIFIVVAFFGFFTFLPFLLPILIALLF